MEKSKKDIGIAKDVDLELMQNMLSMRRFEEKAGQLYGMGKIGGFCHLYIGQEAVAAGMECCITKDDAIITSYRCHALMVSRGADMNSIMAELMGRSTGCSKGKGGSMHMFDIPRNFYGGHGIVAAQTPLGTGIAFANKYRGNNNVCLAYLGDGAANQGQFFESMNMAKLWSLPVIYIIENNEYAMGTSVRRSTGQPDLYKRGEGLGVPGYKVNGMDIFDVMEKGAIAVEHAKSGKGPVILEMKTYRYRGHSMSDPAKYREKEEVQNMKDTKDPIEHLKKYMMENKMIDEDIFKAMDKEIKKKVADAVEFAENSPEPEPSELYRDIYCESRSENA